MIKRVFGLKRANLVCFSLLLTLGCAAASSNLGAQVEDSIGALDVGFLPDPSGVLVMVAYGERPSWRGLAHGRWTGRELENPERALEVVFSACLQTDRGLDCTEEARQRDEEPGDVWVSVLDGKSDDSGVAHQPGFYKRGVNKETREGAMKGSHHGLRLLYGEYHFGMASGLWHAEGKGITASFEMERGLLHGAYERFDDSGRLRERGAYKDGRRSGRWERFYQDGGRLTERFYAGGLKTGTWSRWRPDGSLEYEIDYILTDLANRKADEPAGIWRAFDSSGELVEEVDVERERARRMEREEELAEMEDEELICFDLTRASREEILRVTKSLLRHHPNGTLAFEGELRCKAPRGRVRAGDDDGFLWLDKTIVKPRKKKRDKKRRVTIID